MSILSGSWSPTQKLSGLIASASKCRAPAKVCKEARAAAGRARDPELMLAPAGWEDTETKERRPSSEAAGPLKRGSDEGVKGYAFSNRATTSSKEAPVSNMAATEASRDVPFQTWRLMYQTERPSQTWRPRRPQRL